jgi:hypothetical protein
MRIINTQDNTFTARISVINGDSDQWSSTYTTVNSNSASWGGGGGGGISIGTVQTYLSSNNVLLNGTTVTGDISASGNLTVNAISSRFIDLLHSPANDGFNPVLKIGETDTTGFSGFNLLYDENQNRLQLVTDFGGVSLTAASIDRNANVTVNGPISSNNLITALNGNSNQWNAAYTNFNFTSARDVQSFKFTSSPINIVGSPTYNLFTVPTGYRFIVDMFQLTVIDAPAGAGTPSVQLQRASDSQSLSPTLPIPTSAGKFNVFSIANHNSSATVRNTAPPTGVVNLATTVNSTYTTLSCIAIIQGSLIPTSLYV